MGYTISDHILEWLETDESWTSYDPSDKKWRWQEQYDEDNPEGQPERPGALIDEYVPDCLEYIPSELAAKIDAWYTENTEYPGCYSIYVSPDGRFFPTIEAAFLWKYENEVFKKILEEAFLAGNEVAQIDQELGFNDFWKNYACSR